MSPGQLEIHPEDWIDLQRFGGKIWESSDFDETLQHVLEESHLYLDVDSIAWNVLGGEAVSQFDFTPGYQEAADPLLGIANALAPTQPIIASMPDIAVSGIPGVLAWSDFMTDRQVAETAIYREFYSKIDIQHQMAAHIYHGVDHGIILTAQRSSSSFDSRDKGRLLLLKDLLNRRYVDWLLEGRKAEKLGMPSLRSFRTILNVDSKGDPIERKSHVNSEAGLLFSSGSSFVLPVKNWVLEGMEELDEDRLYWKGELNFRGEEWDMVLARGEDEGYRLVASRFEKVPSKIDMPGLSPRESEVLRWVAEGKTDAEISQILGISYRTVTTHLNKILKKLQVENRIAAARYFWDWRGGKAG